jgi:polysaccharide deacetylase family protein (PEP-CTERM system associated)
VEFAMTVSAPPTLSEICGGTAPVASPRPSGLGALAAAAGTPQTILSIDVEEHHLIEAANGLAISPSLRAHYARRLDVVTRWLLEHLAERGIRATFFVVGQIARTDPALVRAIHRAGHEVASHSWDHQRLQLHTPASFRADVRRSQDALEQVTGEAVVGYRAPTFSLVRQTAWAIDVLAELGILYDSSIFPVYHDRYGVPEAPRGPFLARGARHSLLEIPPATLRLLGLNWPAAGGGYFRLFPLRVMEEAIRQMHRQPRHPVAMLYFHPWEFDTEQARLPMSRLRRIRTYGGLNRSRGRLARLLEGREFVRAVDVARGLRGRVGSLSSFRIPANDAG